MKSKRDSVKLYWYALKAYEWFSDQMPGKTIKKHKRKERQAGKKEIRKALKDV